MRFYKYHALGNDYLVLNPSDHLFGDAPQTHQIRAICHRNFGIGSDGILWGPLPTTRADFGMRVFNPDGSEAEKSGNGLRIFARFLWDQGLVKTPRFTSETPGGVVEAEVLDSHRITVAMGSVSFDSARIPVAGPPREVLNESLTIQNRTFRFSAATIGNPHCVIPLPKVTPELAKRYGPDIEVHPAFPHRTTVQFLQVLDRNNVRLEIWERGAGYTLASGSSSSAACAVAYRLGLVGESVTVHLPGGQLSIEIGTGYSIRLTGPVTRVGEGMMHPELFSAKV